MIRLGLLRHGHTAWNRAGRIQGRTDISLDADARDLLADLRLPDGWSTAHVVSSPLSRATQTARLVTGAEPHTEPALIEMNWGDWEGAHGAQLRADAASGFRDIEDWGWSFCPPNGEVLSDLRARTVDWVNTLTQDTVAICHIGVMRVLLAHACGWGFSGPAPFQIKRNRVFSIIITDGEWSMGPVERLVQDVPCAS